MGHKLVELVGVAVAVITFGLGSAVAVEQAQGHHAAHAVLGEDKGPTTVTQHPGA